MCGILGRFQFKKKIELEQCFFLALGKMAHRGPDDQGYYCHENIFLGMRRLSIIDTEGGHQPISNEDGSIWVVMNGEIYNYLELRQDLINQGHIFKTYSDTEVILHLYEQYGLEGIKYLNGMFAFALYDQKQKLCWVARDRLGIKPFYYFQDAESFSFSSDLNSLKSLIGQNFSWDSESLAHYCAFNFVPQKKSIYEKVTKLAPAHMLLIASDGLITDQCYWQLENSSQKFNGKSLDDACHQLEFLLHSGMALQLRSDVPLAISLSGGVDSSSIAALAAEQIGEITTYTVDFQGKRSEDLFYARQVSQKYKTRAREILIHESDFFNDESYFKYLDEPVADSAMYASYRVAKAAREDGIKVLLSGAGGDEIFGGYHRHFRKLNGHQGYQYLPVWIRKIFGLGLEPLDMQIGLRLADQRFDHVIAMSGAQFGLYSYIAKPDFFKKIKNSVLTEFEEITSDPYSRMKIDLKSYLVDNILALTDKSTMAASIEGRVPLLDHRLVEFAFSLPPEINFHGGMKGLFKYAMREKLPVDLLNRSKEGFNAPVKTWLTPGRHPRCERRLESLCDGPLNEVLDYKKLREVLDGKVKLKNVFQSIYHLYFLATWMEHQGQ